MAPVRIRRTPLEYLMNILERAVSLRLLAEDNVEGMLQPGVSIQELIDEWRPLVRLAENEAKREWVVAVVSFSEGKSVCERVDDVVYDEYADACVRCRQVNGNASNKANRCRVVERKDSICSGHGHGRSSFQLLNVLDDLSQLEWEDFLGHDAGYLPLRNKNIVEKDVPGIGECIILADGLVTQLGLSQNSLRGPGVASLADMLHHPTQCFKNICALYLSNNQIGDEGAIAIANLLGKQHLPIVKLGLNSNGITDIGATAVARAALDVDNPYSCQVEVLGLSHNLISAEGASCIAQIIERNSTIQRLFFNYNESIGEVGGVALAAAVLKHPSLLRLGVAFCSLASRSGQELMNCMSLTDNIERICVSGNCFDEKTENAMKLMPKFNFAEVK